VIFAVPVATPFITPVAIFIVATEGLLLLHAPPPKALVKVALPPRHTASVPVILPGNGLTVTTEVVEHPAGDVYVINAVPAFTPVTTPPVPTVAIVKLPLLHVPPAGAELKDVVAPSHTAKVPVISDGNGSTVITAVALHPDVVVYVTVAVPAATPVIIPVAEPMVNIVAGAELHVPPEVVSDKVPVDPAHILIIPEIDAGSGLTVTVATLKQPVLNV
jgi:hypothetical protein